MQEPIRDLEGVREARAVWDFTTADERRFLDRISLMLQTLESFRARGIATDFVMLIHGPATKFVARRHDGTKFAKDAPRNLADVHAVLGRLSDAGARIEVCLVAMDRCLVAADNLLPFTVIEENVFLNSIALQNKGYAYMWVD